MDCERENLTELTNEDNDTPHQTDIPVVSLRQSLLRQHHLSFNQIKDQPTTSFQHHHHHQQHQQQQDKVVQKETDNQMLVDDLTTPCSFQIPKKHKYNHHESCFCQLCSSLSFSDDSKTEVTRSKPSTWTCSICPLRYKRPADLNRHMKRKHGMSLMKNDKNVLVPIAISQHHNFLHHDLQPLNLSLKCSYSEASVESAESIESEITVDDEQPLDLSGNKNSPIDYRQKTLNKSTDHTIESRICALPPPDKSHVIERSLDALKFSIPNGSTTTNVFQSGRPSISAPSIRYRPYKCSECGRRSNWRWDLNKHIRTSNHPQAYLIELSEYVARATFHEVLKKDNYCDPVFQTTAQSLQCDPATAIESLDHGISQPLKQYMCNSCGYRSNWKCDMSKHLKLHNSADVNLVTEVVVKEDSANYEKCQENKESPAWTSELDLNKHKPFLNSSENKDYLIVKCNSSDGNFPFSTSHTVDARKTKKFKCSACPYRSNFRSDVGRHIRHKHDRATCKIVVMSEAEAASTLGEYMDTWARKKFVPSPNKRRCLMSLPCLNPCEQTFLSRTQMTESPFVVSSTEYTKSSTGTSGQDPEIQTKTLKTKRWWKCSSCDYRDQSKDIIVQHWHYKHNNVTLGADEELSCDVTGISADSESSFHEVCQNKDVGLVQHDFKNHPERLTSYSPCKNKMDDRNTGKIPPQINNLCCDICPYKSSTVELLNFHKSYHEAREGNTISCKFCPYFVPTSSLLNQHLLLHDEEIRNLLQNPQLSETGQNIIDQKSIKDPNLPMNLSTVLFNNEMEQPHDKVSVFLMTNAVRSGGRTTYLCSQCPYVSCNRNDYLYHRQFHRPRPTAFKCPHCPYWVSQKRLLSQHYKVHELDYQQKHRGQEFAEVMVRQTVDYLADDNNNKTSMETSSRMLEQLEIIHPMGDITVPETEFPDKIIETDNKKFKLLEQSAHDEIISMTENENRNKEEDITEESEIDVPEERVDDDFTEEEKGIFFEKLGLTSLVSNEVV